jgi:hypothetical protein
VDGKKVGEWKVYDKSGTLSKAWCTNQENKIYIKAILANPKSFILHAIS